MMKRILLLAALLGAALIPAAAAKTAATTNVSITAAGFVSKNISVAAGDTVKWTNGDTKNHQVACAKCKFTSPVLTPTQTYSYTFTTAGKFAITDVLSNIKGTVTVTAPKVSLTIAATPHTIKYLATTAVSGTVSSTNANQKVTLLEQTCGTGKFTNAANTQTATGGTYSMTRTPTMDTAYQAQVGNSTSAHAAVNVVPSLHLAKTGRHKFRVSVKAATSANSFVGKSVLFQRHKSSGRWVTVKTVTLTRAQALGTTTMTTGTFKAKVRRHARVRAKLTLTQASPCYISARSNNVKS
jgi:plastocyanin